MGAFGGTLQYLEFHPTFAGVGMMSQGLMLAEMRSGFRCRIPHLGGMRMRRELILVITEPTLGHIREFQNRPVLTGDRQLGHCFLLCFFNILISELVSVMIL